MRRIQNQEQIDSRRKRNIQLISLVLLGIMTFSSIGYAFFSNPNVGSQATIENGVENLGGQYRFFFNGNPHIVSSSLSETKNTSFEFTPLLEDYTGTVYVHSESEVVYSEVYNNLIGYSSRIQKACYGNCTMGDLPEKGCDNTIIVYNQSNENRVYQKNGCTFIDGNIRTVDALIYNLFGYS
jgi:hypothetical protein